MEIKIETFEQDLLKRKPLAINLTKIIESTNDINVIALDSSWGTGKTTFIKMWNNMLELDEDYKGNFETLYFNAWENDYIKDPLIAIITEIEKELKKNTGHMKNGLDYIKNSGKKIIKPIAVAAIRAATHSLLDIDKFSLGKENEKEITDMMGKIGEISIENVIKEKEKRSQFVTELKEYIEKNDIKIIFFIDELDRCRPSFAVELLEVIKHIFSIENITFVISIDKEQLSYSIATLYGHGMDSEGYLRRFFDLEYKMPIINKRDYIEFKNETYFNKYQNTEFLRLFLIELFVIDNYNFRDIDKCYEYIKVMIPLFNEFELDRKPGIAQIQVIIISYLFSQMINIKMKHGSIYKKILNLSYGKSEIADIARNVALTNINLKNFFYNSLVTNANLNGLISALFSKYLYALKIVHTSEPSKVNDNEFIVGLKSSNNEYFYGYTYDLLDAIKTGELNIINRMEFVDDFNYSN